LEDGVVVGSDIAIAVLEEPDTKAMSSWAPQFDAIVDIIL